MDVPSVGDRTALASAAQAPLMTLEVQPTLASVTKPDPLMLG